MIRVNRMVPWGLLAGCLLMLVGLCARADDVATQADGKSATTTAKPPEKTPLLPRAGEGQGVKAADAASPAKEPAAVPAAKAAKPKPHLSPALVEPRDAVRRVLAMHQKQPFSTQDNSPTEIMNYCLAFGCATQVFLGGGDGLEHQRHHQPMLGTTVGPVSKCWV